MTGALWAVLHHCALCRRDMAGGSRANSILSLSLCDGGAQAHARATRYARTRVCVEGGLLFCCNAVDLVKAEGRPP